MKARLESDLKGSFNSVLANYYREGRDNMGWHSDNEPELCPKPLIASLSLGATRRFLVRPKRKARGTESLKLDLDHGSLLVMMGGFQQNWQHRVSPTRKDVGGRVNLTFRFTFKKL